MRATIRERGTVRMVLVPLAFIGWAAVAIATAAIITVALSTLVPLLVLAAAFEGVFALHVNVERIGRYVQAFHDRQAMGGNTSRWRSAAARGGGPDALFGRLFIFGVSVNFFPAALGGLPWEIAVVGACHFACSSGSGRRRALPRGSARTDLARFEALRNAPARSPADPEPAARVERPND